MKRKIIPIQLLFLKLLLLQLFFLSRNKADLVLLETGLGGRFDATNVIKRPICNVITPISMDHMNFLGNNIQKIAFEKAGIIKKSHLLLCQNKKK